MNLFPIYYCCLFSVFDFLFFISIFGYCFAFYWVFSEIFYVFSGFYLQAFIFFINQDLLFFYFSLSSSNSSIIFFSFYYGQSSCYDYVCPKSLSNQSFPELLWTQSYSSSSSYAFKSPKQPLCQAQKGSYYYYFFRFIRQFILVPLVDLNCICLTAQFYGLTGVILLLSYSLPYSSLSYPFYQLYSLSSSSILSSSSSLTFDSSIQSYYYSSLSLFFSFFFYNCLEILESPFFAPEEGALVGAGAFFLPMLSIESIDYKRVTRIKHYNISYNKLNIKAINNGIILLLLALPIYQFYL